MADTIIPNNPNNPPTPPTSGNVASLVNKDTLNSLKNSEQVKTFGDQTLDKNKQKTLKSIGESKRIQLEREKVALIKEGHLLEINHKKKLFELDQQNKLYNKLKKQEETGETENTVSEPIPPQLSQSEVTAGTPPYRYETSSRGKTSNQIEIKIYDKNNTLIVDYILEYPNTSFNDIKQSTDSIIDQLKKDKDQAKILKNKRYLIHIYGIPEDQKISQPSPSKGLSDEEYQVAVEIENKNYNESLKNLQERKDNNKKALDELKKDKKQKQKNAKKKRKDRLKKRKTKLTEEERKARKAKRKAVLKNGAKSLVPIVILLLTDPLADIIAQNEKIGKLVDDTNDIITDANESGDPIKLQNAKLARDNAIRIIQSNEDKIIKIRDQINRISTYISIFSIIVNIISIIPIPTSIPPGIGIPVSLIIKLIKILDKANRILLSLSAAIPILLGVLEKAIDILQDYKTQLLDINGQLENAASSGIGGTGGLLNNGVGVNGDSGIGGGGGIQVGILEETYKGFRFAIKEEENPKFVVRGYKRRYAVAINKRDIETVKSDYSFTLDPNNLIEQLKLIIDQRNLQA